MNKKILATSILALSCCLTACGGNKKEQLADDFSQIQETATDSDATKAVDFAPTNVSDKRFDFSADRSGSSNAKIYSAKVVKYTDDYLKSFAEKAFDKDTWQICKPYEICTKTELDDALSEIDYIDENSEHGKVVPFDYRKKIENAISNYNDNNAHELGDGACITEYNTETGVAEGALIKGEINGTNYAMIYTNLNIDHNGNADAYETLYYSGNPAELRIERLTPSYLYQGTHNEDYTMVDGSFQANTVDEATAQSQAEDFLSMLGLDDYVVIDSGKRACIIDDLTSCYNGYSFTFVREIDGVRCPLFNNDEILDLTQSYSDEKCYVSGLEEYIRVDVDEQGIVLADFYHMYEIGDVVSKDVNMISFDKAVSIANNYVCDCFMSTSNPVKVNARFAYIPFVYEDQSVFVPAWVFSEPAEALISSEYFSEKDMVMDNCLTVINALDGSEIAYSGLNAYSLMYQDIYY